MHELPPGQPEAYDNIKLLLADIVTKGPYPGHAHGASTNAWYQEDAYGRVTAMASVWKFAESGAPMYWKGPDTEVRISIGDSEIRVSTDTEPEQDYILTRSGRVLRLELPINPEGIPCGKLLDEDEITLLARNLRGKLGVPDDQTQSEL